MSKINIENILNVILDKKIVAPTIIIVCAVVLYLILKKILKRLLNLKLKNVRVNTRKQKTSISLIENILKYFIALVALVMILDVYGIDTKSLIASLGVISLVAGLALQDFLKDIIAGISILFEDQYAVGDVVTIGGFKGTVSYLGIKSTRITAYTGEVLIISNRNIDKVINHTLENSTCLLDFSVSYTADLDKVREILNIACDKINNSEELNIKSPAKICGVESLSDSSVDFRIVFGCKYSNKYDYERYIREMVKKLFDENNIEIPFNQVVVHNGE